MRSATIVYQDSGREPVTVSAVNLDVENLGVSTPVDIKLSLAALGRSKNVSLTGKVGPLINNGSLDLAAIPLAFSAELGPLRMAELKGISANRQSLTAGSQDRQPRHGQHQA